MEYTAQVASSVIFVSELDRSVAFYRDVFACEVAIGESDAALLLAPVGSSSTWSPGAATNTPWAGSDTSS